MAAIADILIREAARKANEVVLFKEGMFWRAYEQSAYLMATHHKMNAQKKFVKIVGQEVAYVGFPESSWEKFTNQKELPDKGEKIKVVLLPDADISGFENWKAQIKTVEQTRAELREKMEASQRTALQIKQAKRRAEAQLGRELPVYQVCYDLLKDFLLFARKIDRDVRYNIGQKIQELLMHIAVITRKTQRESDPHKRIKYIDEALTARLEAELYLRLLFDMKMMSWKKYTDFAFRIVELEKHLENWRKYIAKTPHG